MALNEKIIQKKLAQIAQIMNEDGGTSLIDVLGLLEYAKYITIKQAEFTQMQTTKKEGLSYKQLKAKRVGDIRAG